MSSSSALASGGIALLALAPLAPAQSLHVALEESQIFAGSMVVTGVGRAELDESGRWFAFVQVRNIRDINPATPAILDASGFVHPADPLFLVPAAAFDANPLGELVAAGSIGSPLCWNHRLLAAQGDPVLAPGVPAGTTYDSFLEVRIAGRTTTLTRAQLSSGPALLRLRFDPASTVAPEVLLFQDPRATGIAHNERGDWLAAVSEAARPGGSILLNGAAVARAGDPSPVAGRSYRTLNGAGVDLDHLGRSAFGAELDGPQPDSILVRHGAVLARAGDVLPALAPGSLGPLLATPVQLANSGDLYWFADVVGGADALMRNLEVIVRPGVTQVGTRGVTRVDPVFSISPSGRFWCGRVELDGAQDAILLADFGLAEPVGGCRANAGTLALGAGRVRAGSTIELEVAGPSTLGGALRLSFSRTRLADAQGCGLAVGPGELVIDPRTRLGTLSAGLFTGAPVRFTLAIPVDPALIDLELFGQGIFRRVGAGDPRVAFTNALRLEIGAP